MSKLLNSTLEKVSENNNDYRKSLRKLNNQIDERTTALVGDIVTLSNYTTDFSSTITASKEKLVNPILRVIESYVIKDLRSVETVNEQFIDKINDKIENTSINTKEDKEKFVSNLNNMLNDKYLQIVSIKRVNFIGENGNEDIENIVNDFINYLNSVGSYDVSGLSSLINNYKKDIYSLVSNTLSEISSLYLDNFVNQVNNDLTGAIDFDDDYVNNSFDEFKPFIPDINPVKPIDIPIIPEVPNLPNEENGFVNMSNEDISISEPNLFSSSLNTLDEAKVSSSVTTPFENDVMDNNDKKKYDVEEILKIAKSPVAAVSEEESSISNNSPFSSSTVKEPETFEMEFNEREIVEEMIRRFTKRLQQIDERQADYDEKIKLALEDEKFVNDLIASAKEKKSELDAFEDELDNKERELNDKEDELEKKINNVLPFANAVLESDKES